MTLGGCSLLRPGLGIPEGIAEGGGNLDGVVSTGDTGAATGTGAGAVTSLVGVGTAIFDGKGNLDPFGDNNFDSIGDFSSVLGFDGVSTLVGAFNELSVIALVSFGGSWDFGFSCFPLAGDGAVNFVSVFSVGCFSWGWLGAFVFICDE